MSKSGRSIIGSARHAVACARGARDGFVAHVPEEAGCSCDPHAARPVAGRVCDAVRFKLDALQNWEGRRRPDPDVRAFLRVIEREPEAVLRALTD